MIEKFNWEIGEIALDIPKYPLYLNGKSVFADKFDLKISPPPNKLSDG